MSNRRKPRRPQPTHFTSPRRHQPGTATWWNGEPASAIKVRVIVADAPQFPQYWARDLIGTERAAVRVEYHGRVFYLDDEDGSGWRKVINGGGPGHPHRDLAVERVIYQEPAQ